MDRGQAVPIFIQVAETLRGRILNNEYPAGDLIPSARELEKEFRVSNITIRKALELLTQEGYLIPRRGVGTQVAKVREEMEEIEISGNFRGWIDSASGRRSQLKADVLEATIAPCPERVSQILGLEPGQNVWRMKRVRKIKGQPISYFVNYGSPEILGRIKPEEVVKCSFIEVFQEVCGLKLSRLEQRVQAVVADMDLSSILGVRFGDPLFFVEAVYFSEAGKPVEVTHMYYRADRYVYKATIEL